MALAKLIKAVFGDHNERVVRALRERIQAINDLEPRLEALDDAELRAQTPRFHQRLDEGETVDDLLPEAFATAREAARRTLGLRPYDVQLIGGLVLHEGKIAEMATGEGKTLTAVLPAYLNALTRRGVFIVTVNDYLARRDAAWMAPVYDALGMTVGAIQNSMDPAQRRQEYAANITFGTNNEFGFDYLRDNMKSRPEDQVQADLHYAIIDEVDSILIDEARTPLIISGMPEQSTRLYYDANNVARKLKPGEDFEIKEKEHQCVLTEDGIDHAQRLAGVDSFYDGAHMEWPHQLEQALRAHFIYQRDKDYVVQPSEDGQPEVVIVDEFTGRLMPGRRWSDGLHQAVEAKEGIRIREELQTLATITFQNYFRLYDKIAGMTGTAMTEAAEFHQIYGLDVVSVPTNRPVIRDDRDDVVYRTRKEKWTAISDEIEEIHGRGQPILVGTTSIESSEHLSGMLKRRGIRHEVLNAKHHAREADIVAQAGRKGAVTVATNMAGRGTDIVLGGNPEALTRQYVATHEGADEQQAERRFEAECAREKEAVLAAGGLYVLGTERHEARRIDNQLRGRSGRQGDPGVTRFYLSLEDDLMRIFAREWVSGLLEKLGMTEGQEIESRMVTRGIEKAQKRVEQRNFEIRKNLLEYDEVMDSQRKTIYGKRQEILEGGDLSGTILEMCAEVAERIVLEHAPDKGEIDGERLVAELSTKFNTTFELSDAPGASHELSVAEDPPAVVEQVMACLRERYDERRAELGDEQWSKVERFLLLNTVDSRWKDHLRAMDDLKRGIGLRGYAQVDPKIEYKREGYDKFQMLLSAIAEEVTGLVFRLQIQVDTDRQLAQRWAPASTTGPTAAPGRAMPQALAAMSRGRERAAAAAGRQAPRTIVNTDRKVGRNAPCPCGSGKKYKQCHGR